MRSAQVDSLIALSAASTVSSVITAQMRAIESPLCIAKYYHHSSGVGRTDPCTDGPPCPPPICFAIEGLRVGQIRGRARRPARTGLYHPLLRVVEDHAKRISSPGLERAYAMSHHGAIETSRPLNWSLAHRKNNGFTLLEGY